MSEISGIILRAIKSKRDPEVYGASYAMEMNTELAEKAAAEIASLPRSSAGNVDIDAVKRWFNSLPGESLSRTHWLALLALLNEPQSSSMRTALEDVSNWLDGCLRCTSWSWDGLQREAAEDALKEARACLALSRPRQS